MNRRFPCAPGIGGLGAWGNSPTITHRTIPTSRQLRVTAPPDSARSLRSHDLHPASNPKGIALNAPRAGNSA